MLKSAMNDELINEIVCEVMKRLDVKRRNTITKSYSAFPSKQTKTNKLEKLHCCIISSSFQNFQMFELNCENRNINYIHFHEIMRKQYELFELDSKSNACNYELLLQQIKNTDFILAGLSTFTIANLVTGVSKNYFEECLLYAMLIKKPIVILKEYSSLAAFSQLPSTVLSKKYMEYEKQLQNQGVLFLSQQVFLRYTVKKTDKKLLVQKDLVELIQQKVGLLLLSRDTIVTPNAYEYAKEHSLFILQS